MTLILDEKLENDKDTVVIKAYNRNDKKFHFFRLTGLSFNGFDGKVNSAINLNVRADMCKEMTELETCEKEYIDDFPDDPEAPDFSDYVDNQPSLTAK